jgi:hypothetical protein
VILEGKYHCSSDVLAEFSAKFLTTHGRIVLIDLKMSSKGRDLKHGKAI